MRRLLVLAATLLCALAGAAQAQPRLFTQAELDTLLAPVALHPDSVLSQVLIAATYPEEIAAAAAWSRANPHLSGEEAVRAADGQPWDPAVRALVAFPDLLARMDESPQWLSDLGQAFLAQEPQVMDTVQALRRRAQAAGHLGTTDHVAVYHQGEAIVVQPRTQVVYVHYYDPYVVYGPWWWPHYRPVFWRPWVVRPVFFSHVHVHSHPDWRHRRVYRRNIVSVRPHVRVPESQRRPIVQSAPLRQPMPAASGFSNPNRDRVQQRRVEPRRQAHVEPRREARVEQRREPRRLDSPRSGGRASHDYWQRGGRNGGGARGNAPHARRAH